MKTRRNYVLEYALFSIVFPLIGWALWLSIVMDSPQTRAAMKTMNVPTLLWCALGVAASLACIAGGILLLAKRRLWATKISLVAMIVLFVGDTLQSLLRLDFSTVVWSSLFYGTATSMMLWIRGGIRLQLSPEHPPAAVFNRQSAIGNRQ